MESNNPLMNLSYRVNSLTNFSLHLLFKISWARRPCKVLAIISSDFSNVMTWRSVSQSLFTIYEHLLGLLL
jgi:hypothetical protein